MRIKSFTFALIIVAAGGGSEAACLATSPATGTFTNSGTDNSSGTGNSGGGSGSSDGPGSGSGGLGIGVGSATGSGSGGSDINPPCNVSDPNKDNDGDGYTTAQGDCNDCSAAMNPGAEDFPGNGIDEDCNGTPDDDPTNCDANLQVGSNNAVDGAKAIGLCKTSTNGSWGLKSASYQTADGQLLANVDPQGLGHGILSGFGPNVHPQEGVKLLALSSGTARQPNDPGYMPVTGYDKGYTTGAPPGYPKESPSCPGVQTGEPHDSAGLFVQIKTPTNAKSLKFNLNFYTYEWPQYICSPFNDFFVAMMTPTPMGQQDGNISFDTKGNVISVNAGFLQVCGCDSGPPCQASGGTSFACALGSKGLVGTGFDQDDSGQPNFNNSAATGWLQTETAIQQPGGDISLLFAIWDSGDGVLDSTVLIDNFAFDVSMGSGTNTIPIGVPK